jgi:hypothetical protein
VDPFPDPVLAYAAGGRDARITTTNASFERQFGDVSPESFVPTGFDRCSRSTTTGNHDPITHVVRGDRVGIYLDDPENRRTFLARVIPSGDGTGYLVFSDPEDCPTTEKPPAVDQVGIVPGLNLRNPLDVAKPHLTAARETGDPDHFESVTDAHDRRERIIENQDGNPRF